jgi:hypothetical protein
MTGVFVNRRCRVCLVCALAVCLSACLGGQHPPRNVHDLCDIFRENRDWYESAHESQGRWGVPIPVMMAIIYQESEFEAEARPPRTSCLWIFPGPRPSSALGYAQALDTTWKEYQRYTGNTGADRDDFGDAVDFVGWYCYMSHKRCKIARNDAYSLYLAYHEGQGGFNRGTYQRKTWLKQAAVRVKSRAKTYERQLASCESEFQRKRPCFWFF